MNRDARTQLGEALEVSLQINSALAHRRPLHRCAVRRFPDGGIAQAGREHIRREDFEAGQRIFQGPDRVAGIHVRPDIILARRFDQRDEFPRLHVARVILDGDLHAGIDRSAALALADLHGIGDARLDAAFGPAIIAIAQHDTEDRRPERLGHANAEREMLLRRAPLIFEALRGRANAPGAELDLQSLIRCLALQAGEIAVVEVFEGIEIRDEE